MLRFGLIDSGGGASTLSITSATSSTAISSAAPSSTSDTSTSTNVPACVASVGATCEAATAIFGSLAANRASPEASFGSTRVAGDDGTSGWGMAATASTASDAPVVTTAGN